MWSVDASRIAREVGLGRTHQHRHAAVLLRPVERHRPRDRRATGQGEHREGLQASRPHGRRAQPRRRRPGAAGDAPAWSRARPPTPTCACCRPSPRAPRTSCATSPLGCWRGRATCCPSAPCPSTAPSRPGTARWEKRSLADAIPVWDADLCIDCGKCAIVCPHAAIRMKAFPVEDLDGCSGRLPEQGLRRSRAAGGHAPDRSRWRPTTARAAASASTSARRAASRRPSTRPSTCCPPSSIATSSACATTSSSASRRSTGARSATTRSRARSCSSRCSSSPAPAPAAARPRT